MAENLTPEQVRQRYNEALPPEVGPLYLALHNSLAGTYLSWTMFKELYANSAERVELLNRSASGFFLVVQNALRRDVLLGIARITDPPATGTSENASIPALAKDLRPHLSPPESEELVARSARLVQSCDPIRQQRNKLIAHSDKLVAIRDPDAPVIPGVPAKLVDGVLGEAAAIINQIGQIYKLGTTFFDLVIHQGGVDALLFRLRDSEILSRGDPEAS